MPGFRRGFLVVLALVTPLSTFGGPDTTAVHSQSGHGFSTPTSTFDESSSPILAGARHDPRWDNPVDLVIETPAQWEAHRQAMAENPRVFDGMVIGVVLPPEYANPGAGKNAAEADASQMARETPAAPARPPCATDIGSPSDDFGIFVACRGREPDAYFVRLEPPDKPPGMVSGDWEVRAKLDLLTQRMDGSYENSGYYSPLAQAEKPITSIQLEGSTLSIDFSDEIISLGIEDTLRGATFVDQVLATAFSVQAVHSVNMTMQGDCIALSTALRKAGPCEARTRADLQLRDQ